MSLEQKDPVVVRVRGLEKRFGDIIAVNSLDLDIPPGQIFGLLGPNGAGKSTTIRILTTLMKPTSGSARIDGFDILEDPVEVRRRIGYVPQAVSADGGLTAYENLLLSARLYGMPHNATKDRIFEALHFMGLESDAARLVRTYSGGMIRRLEIAQALLHRPAVLFLDEPTVGLDPMARRAVWERLKNLQQRLSTTILITTHDMEEADVLCDELALMHHGEKKAEGRPADLKAAVGPQANLSDVFALYCGSTLDETGNYHDIQNARKTARRLG